MNQLLANTYHNAVFLVIKNKQTNKNLKTFNLTMKMPHDSSKIKYYKINASKMGK
jgi:hypothetical protein